MSLLDWSLVHGLEPLPEVALAELCILGRLTDLNHPVFAQVKFSKPVYEALAYALLPSRFPDLGWERDALGPTDEAAWAWSVIHGLPRPSMPADILLPTDYLSHRVFWATDFGVLPAPDRQDVVEALQLGWMIVKVPDAAAKIAMALHMLAAPIDAQDVQAKIVQGDPASHEEYHRHLTADCWRALARV